MSDSVRPQRQKPTRLPPSLGFSRQEHWSGLPFPSPMHENEKWKWSCSVMSNSSWPHGLQPTRLLHPWDFPGKSTGVGCHCLLHIAKYMYLLIDISPGISQNRKRSTKKKPVITEWGQKDVRSLTVSPDVNTDFDHHLWIRGSLWGSRSLAEARQHAARAQRLKTGCLTEG